MAKAKGHPGGDRKNKMVQIRMTEELFLKAEELAEAIGISVSGYIRMALIEKVAKDRKDDQD